MAEKLFARAVKGGKNTKIVTLNGKKMTQIPPTVGQLPGLKTLDLQNNLIPTVCSQVNTLTQVRNRLCFWIKDGKEVSKQ